MRLVLLLVLLSAPVPAQSLTLTPADDLQAALDQAAPGDVITLTKGTYFGTFTIPEGRDGLTLRGKGPVVLDARPEGVPSGTGLTVLSQGVTVQGLRLRHARNGVAAEGLRAGAPGVPVNGLRLIKLTVENAEGAAISVTGDDLFVSNCSLIGNGSGLVVIGAGAQVRGTEILNTTSFGVQVVGSSALVDKCRIATTGPAGGGVLLTGTNSAVTRTRIENCGGVALTATGAGLHIAKNTVEAGRLAAIVISLTGAEPESVVDGNRVTACEGAGLLITGGPGLTVSRNIVRDGGRSGPAAFLLSTNGVRYESNLAEDNARTGFRISGDNNTFFKDVARRNLIDGFAVLSGNLNSLEKCVAQDNGGEGFQNDDDDGGEAPATFTALRDSKAKGNRRDIAVRNHGFQPLADVSFETGGNNPQVPSHQPQIED